MRGLSIAVVVMDVLFLREQLARRDAGMVVLDFVMLVGAIQLAIWTWRRGNA